MNKRFSRGLWWVKRDFRLCDNEALCHAIELCDTVVALFIIEPALCKAPESSFLHFLAWQQACEHLSEQLDAKGGRLITRVGNAADVFEDLYKRYQFEALFSHQETGSELTYKRDCQIVRWAHSHKVPWFESFQNGVVRGLQNRDDRQPVIRERLFESQSRATPSQFTAWSDTPSSDAWPSFETVSGRLRDERIQVRKLQPVTEADAQKTLQAFLYDRGVAYAGGISSPNTAFAAGSRLSVHLAWGTISLRQVFTALRVRTEELAKQPNAKSAQWRKSLNAFQARLHWHDHFMQRLESAPDMERAAINPAYRHIEYGDCKPVLQAWMQGTTGLPLVDACVRCLAATGFLNFRMRAMLVTTGCFGLAQSWQALQYPLARLFLDYEPGIHFSQIQMQAGVVGINTLRVYSPHKQLVDHDPHGAFVKKWIPELRPFSADSIRNYESESLGDYPEPIVDIKSTAKIIKDQIYAVRKSEQGQEEAARMLDLHGSRKRAASNKKTAAKKNQIPDAQLKLDFD
ncbi:MAG: FAD-binding domain-containing protein [Granulosicoccus sp.]